MLVVVYEHTVVCMRRTYGTILIHVNFTNRVSKVNLTIRTVVLSVVMKVERVCACECMCLANPFLCFDVWLASLSLLWTTVLNPCSI